MKVGLASPRIATSLDDGLEKVDRLIAHRFAPERYGEAPRG